MLVPFLAWNVADGRLFGILGNGVGLFFPFITGKNFGFRLLVEIAFVAWVYLAVRYPEYRIKKSVLLIAYSVFIGVLFVADLFGVDGVRSFFSNYERMEGFVTHIHLFAYFIMLISVLRTKDEWHKALNIFLGSNALVLLWGYFQLLGSPKFFLATTWPAFSQAMSKSFPIHMSDYRLDSTLGNSAYFAIYTAIFLGIAGILYVQEQKKNWKIIYAVMALLNLIALYYTATRGTIVGLIAGIFIGCLWLAIFGEKTQRKIYISVCASMVAIVLIFISIRGTAFVKNSPILSRFAAISLSDNTTLSRITLWKISYQGWKERPILGYGQDNFGYVFARHYDPVMYDQEPWFDRSHNVFFDWLIAGGILGLLSYLSLFVAAMYLLYKKRADFSVKEQALLIGSMVTYFIHNMLVFDNLVSYILFFTLLAYIAVRTQSPRKETHSNLRDYQYVIEPLAVLLTLVVFWYGVYKPYMANVTLIRAVDVNSLSQKYSVDKVVLAQLDAFNEALSYNSLGSLEIREQQIQYGSRLVTFTPNLVSDAEKTAYVQAVQAYLGATKKAIDEAPETERNDVRELGLYGGFFNAVHDFTDAETYGVLAHKLSPKKQRTSFTLIATYLGENKVSEAYNLALETYLYEPRYVDAAVLLAATSVYAHKEQEVSNLLTAHGQSFPLSGEVIDAYINTGNTNKAIELLLAYKKKFPNEAATVDAVIKQLLDKANKK